MENGYKKLFDRLQTINPPKGLDGRILLKIKTEQKNLERKRIFVFGGSTLASFGLSVWAFVYLIESIKETGFWQYISLLFSENGAILAYWRELSYSLIEALPIFGVISVLASVGFFIWSITSALKQNYGFGKFA